MTTRSIPRRFEIVDRHALADVWLWPNRLTLQAPVVAILWQLLLARSMHVELGFFEPCALGLAVWLIYVADHLIDTTRPTRAGQWEPPRKEFCRMHWHKFLVAAITVSVFLVVSASRFLWLMIERGGWQLSVAVACYFALIHLPPKHWRRDWPREILVAGVFTLGVFEWVWVKGIAPLNIRYRFPAVAAQLAVVRCTCGISLSLVLWASGALLTLLVFTNCSLIETWEWDRSGAPDVESPNLSSRWVAEHLAGVGTVIALLCVVCGWASLLPAEFATAGFLSGVGLAVLSIYRRRIPIQLVSPAADLALCSPLVVMAFACLR